MKLSILFLILGMSAAMANSSYSQSAEISLELKDKSLKEVFREIESKSEFIFFYNDIAVDLNRKVSISAKNEKLEKVLNKILKGTSTGFKISDRQVTLFSEMKKEEAEAAPTNVQQEKKVVSGNVSDANDVLIGVAIKVKGTTIGAISDYEGNFFLTIPDGDVTLVFSYVGYLTQEIKVGSQTKLQVKMEEDPATLDEVVVVGFSSQRKISVIGAQSGLTHVEELKQPVANMTTVIAGRIAGVVGVQRTGDPGNDNADIWIRGISTFSNSSPLVLVDGVEREFANIDPEDIESFQILKDASATAVYGVKGANGVIIITTKQGRKGKPRIRMEYNKGFTSFTKTPDLADGITYMQMANEAALTRGKTPIYTEEKIRKTYTGEDPYLYPSVLWMDEIFQDYGQNQKANISVNGGSDFAQFYVSAGYYDEQGMYKVNKDEQYDASVNFKRYNFTTNLNMQITKTTEVVLGVKGYSSTRTAPVFYAEDIFTAALNTYPILYPATFYPDGDKLPFISTGGGLRHPYGMLTRYGSRSEDKNQTYADLRLKQNLDVVTKGLYFRALFSFDNYNYNRIKLENTSPVVYYAKARDENGNLVYERQDNGNGKKYLGYEKDNKANRRYYFETSLNYDQIFNKVHRVGGLFLYNQSDYRKFGDDITNMILAAPYRSLGIAGRATYSYNDKYLTEFNFGYNGSENFSPDKRFGFFPSFGVGWVPSNESFFEPLHKYIQFLKFRFSWGQAGNDKLGDGTNGRRFAYIPLLDDGGGGFMYGRGRDNAIGGLDISDYAVDVTWETSTKTNLGIDIHTLKNSLVIQLDLFKDRREDIFLQRAGVPDYVGIRKQDWGNLGMIDNKGFEVSIDWNKKFGDWNIGLKGNYTFNQSKILEDDTSIKPYPWMNSRGLPRFYRMGYVFDRFYSVEDEAKLYDPSDKTIAKPSDLSIGTRNYLAGDLKYQDLNGDGIINENDMTSIGKDQVPQVVYGFGLNIGYKGFALGAFFQGVDKCDISLSASSFIPYGDAGAKGNVYANIQDRWTEQNPREDAIWPRLNYGGKINSNYESSTFWLRNGAFLRLKTLDFGYTIPAHITKKWGLENLRVYFLGYNLLTFTGFDMYDVELGSGFGTRYPNIKTYSLGLTLSF